MEHISNEQKAKEIAKKLSYPNIDSFGDGDNEFDTRFYHTNKDAALQAMQWKDEQHAQEKQKLIDEACEWINDNADKYASMHVGGNESETYPYVTDDLVKDFKKHIEKGLL